MIHTSGFSKADHVGAHVLERRVDRMLPAITSTILDVSGAARTFLPEFRHLGLGE